MAMIYKLKVENTSGKNYFIGTQDSTVNGGMPMDLVTFIVTESGQETENPSMFILRDDMIEAGIESISEVKFKYYIFEFEDLDHPIISDEITILSSLNDNH